MSALNKESLSNGILKAQTLLRDQGVSMEVVEMTVPTLRMLERELGWEPSNIEEVLQGKKVLKLYGAKIIIHS